MSPPLNIGYEFEPAHARVSCTYREPSALPSLASAARALGGQVSGGQILCPGPGHSAADRSLSVRFEPTAPEGFVVHSFASDNALECRDYVRSRLGLDQPDSSPGASTFGGARPAAEYIYRCEDGAPFLKVTRWPPRPDGGKAFSQAHWDGQGWERGKPKDDPLPYRLPELLAAPAAPVFICEGEKDADNLAARGLIATTNPEGAGKWRPELNRWFQGRSVYVLADNDEPGRRHAASVAGQLQSVVADIKVIALPGLPLKGDVTDWLASGGDPSELPALCRELPDARKRDPSDQDALTFLGLDRRSALSAFTFDGAAPIEAPRWLVKGILPPEGVAFIGGQSGAGKTFIAIDLARALATGSAFFGRPCKERVAVVILAAEGAGTLPHRVAAAKQSAEISGELPVAWLASVPDLRRPENVLAVGGLLRHLAAYFTEACGIRLGAVIIDTVAAAFALEDMNNGAEAAKVIDACRKLGAASGALVLPIHHYGKDASSGLLGSHIFRAGADAILSVLAERDVTTGDVKDRALALAKSRTSVEGPIAGFELEFVHLGEDEDGEAFGACVVRPDLETPSKLSPRGKSRSLPRGERALKAAIEEALSTRSEKVRVQGDGPLVSATRLRHVREAFGRFYVVDEDDAEKRADAIRKAFKRALDRLGPPFASGTWAGEQWIWSL